MMDRAEQYPDILRGWKTYCAWGDVPYTSGWTLDTDTGMAFLEQVLAVHRQPADPAGRGHPQGLRAARLRPARRAAARHRAGRPRLRACASWSTTRATTRATRQAYAGDDKATSSPTRSTRSSRACARTTGTRRSSSRRARSSATCPTSGPSSARSGARHARPRPGRAPARQADHVRRAEAHRVGHRQPLVRLAAGGDRRDAPLRVQRQGEGVLRAAVGPRRATSRTRRARRASRAARSATASSAATPHAVHSTRTSASTTSPATR